MLRKIVAFRRRLVTASGLSADKRAMCIVFLCTRNYNEPECNSRGERVEASISWRLAAQGPVGTRGGVEWMRGPGACPGWGATCLLHAVPKGSRCHQDKHQAPTLPHIRLYGVATS